MIGVFDSLIVRFAARVQAPLLQLYALYVLFHGHYSPGGGFQAGAALAASFLLPRIAEGYDVGSRRLSTRGATVVAIVGVALYGGVGLLSLLLGGDAFLDYAAIGNLPGLPDGAAARAIGTLTIEAGVTMTVMGVMITLYDDLAARPREAL